MTIAISPAFPTRQRSEGIKRLIYKHINGLFMLPALLIIGFVTIYPAFFGIYISFQKYGKGQVGMSYVGLANYASLLSDLRVRNSLIVSSKYILFGVVFTTLIGFILAYLINQKITVKAPFMIAILIPWVMSEVVAALMWEWILDSKYGILTEMLAAVGVPRVAWLAGETTALIATIVVSVWRSVGFSFVMLLAALQGISADVEDAARVDGASRWGLLRHITLPLIRAQILITVTLLTLSFLNGVTLVMTMTYGGPLHATEVAGFLLYSIAFTHFELGYAASFSTVILIINLLLVGTYIRLFHVEELY